MIAKLTKAIAARRYFCATALLCCAGAAALVATHALAAEAFPSTENVASATLAALPQAESFLNDSGVEDQRVPLSSTAARMGVIVVVSGGDIHIMRPDGTESRLHGKTPKAASPRRSDDPAPLISDGEVWVRPNDVLALLAPSDPKQEATPKPPPAKPTQTTAGFETFEVQKPVVAAPEPPRTQLRQPQRASLLVTSPKQNIMTELSASAMSLAFNRTTILHDQDLRGFYAQSFGAPRHLDVNPRGLDPESPYSPVVSYLSLEVTDGARRYSVGDASDPLFGSATGIAFSTAVSKKTRAGASVMLPSLREGDRGDGQLGIRAETLAGKNLVAEAAVAGDGAYYTAARWNTPGLSLRVAALQGSDNRRSELWWRAKVLPAVSLMGRSSAIGGGLNARADGLSVAWTLGRAQASVERARASSDGEPWLSDSISLSLFRSNLTGIFRYLVSRQGEGRNGLEWTLSRLGRHGRQVFLSSSAPQVGAAVEPRSYRVGVHSEVNRKMRARIALVREGSGFRPELSVEIRPSVDQIISVGYGAFDAGTPGTGLGNAVVIQAALAFGGPKGRRQGVGRIQGRVTDDANQGVPDVAVMLNDKDVTLTRSDGSYEFAGLLEGRYNVKLDPSRIPADYSGGQSAHNVSVTSQETGSADFRLTRLCQISGSVYIELNGQGQRQPLSGLVVELNTGTRTTTDDAGRYSFAGLGPGKYTVSLISDTSGQSLIPVPPTSWSLRLAPGDKAAGADFRFLQRRKPVLFGQLSGTS
jgi:hypothetical protein